MRILRYGMRSLGTCLPLYQGVKDRFVGGHVCDAWTEVTSSDVESRNLSYPIKYSKEMDWAINWCKVVQSRSQASGGVSEPHARHSRGSFFFALPTMQVQWAAGLLTPIDRLPGYISLLRMFNTL